MPKKYMLSGDSWQVGNIDLNIFGPTVAYLKQTRPGGTIDESREFANVITVLMNDRFHILFTGDSQTQGLTDAIQNISAIDVLQSPHYESWTCLDFTILDQLTPKLAVISVDQNNYGHPNKKTISLMQHHGIKYVGTAQAGDVEIVSDEKSWSAR